MVDFITLSEGPATLILAPELGGAVARLDVDGIPVLRPWDGVSRDPFSMACNPLVPFSNRISNDGFEWNGNWHSVSANLDGEALPIHGDGFQRRWHTTLSENTAIVSLPDGRIGPWRYEARQHFQLCADKLLLSLQITSTSDRALPFGLGIHPWFPRTAQTKLQFGADSFWSEDRRNLPVEQVRLELQPDWSFSELRSLPDGWINNAYCNWEGRARIHQGQGARSCTISAQAPLGTAIVYSPSSSADFFCFEPVSHPVDAFHLDGRPGIFELRPGESVSTSVKISWRDA